MTLLEVKETLKGLKDISFQLPDNSFIPQNFHITEVGVITKKFIDCGSTIRSERKVILQLWEDEKDIDHRLKPNKLLDIIQLSEKALAIQDAQIEVEYQGSTIEKYGLEFDDQTFILTNTSTDCLAKNKCGIPQKKSKLDFAAIEEEKNAKCAPESGCC